MSWRPPAPTPAGRQWAEAYLLPILVILMALSLHLHGLESKSLWFDELGTLTGSGWGGSWMDAIRNPLTIPTTPKPPLSFVVTRLFLLVAERVFLLRLPAALFATLTIPLLYALGRSLFNRQAGLLGATLLGIAPLHIRYAQEARMYAMLVFFSILSLYLFWRAVRSTDWRWWIGFVLSTVLSLYTHLFALLPLGVMTLFGLWLLIRPHARSRYPFRAWHLFVALAIILLAYAPMVPFVSQGLVSGEGLGGEAARGWDLRAVVSAVRLFSAGNVVGLVVYVLLFAAAVVAVTMKDREVLVLTTMWIVLPPIIVLGLPFGHLVLVRYFLFSLPVYLLLVAYGLQVVGLWFLDRVSPRLGARSQHPAGMRSALGVLATFALLGILVGISAPSLLAYYAEAKQNWRDATWLVHSLAGPGDKILVRHVYHQKGILFYQRQQSQASDTWTEDDVQILPYDLTVAFPPDAGGSRWLVVPLRDNFLPGGSLEASIEPDYRLRPPFVLSPSEVSRDGQIIAPTSFRPLAVVQAVRIAPPSIRFWADDDSITAGDCTWLHWEVDNVQAVYLAGEGVVGSDTRRACPKTTTNYELEVLYLDDTLALKTIEIVVSKP